jgi:hypothetical protein
MEWVTFRQIATKFKLRRNSAVLFKAQLSFSFDQMCTSAGLNF